MGSPFCLRASLTPECEMARNSGAEDPDDDPEDPDTTAVSGSIGYSLCGER